MIRLRHVDKHYASPSGAGKATLLSVIGMLDADWQGE